MKVTDQLTDYELSLLMALVEMEKRRIRPDSKEDEVLHQRLLDLGMIQGKLLVMQRELRG